MPHALSERMIGKYPPNDGREWNCQCARCGSSVDDDGICLSDPYWCEVHPLQDRKGMARGKVEWFTFDGV